MVQELHQLTIDKSLKAPTPASSTKTLQWLPYGIAALVLILIARPSDKPEVQAVPVAEAPARRSNVSLNATGYIVAHHKIQVASKVVGKVAWIGVEKGDLVSEGQIIVRLEDAEFVAQLRQAQGNLATAEARLLELKNGARPEEIGAAKANLESAQADLANAKVTFVRVQKMVDEGVAARQQLDDAKARFEVQSARAASLERTYELVRSGPRPEALMQAQGQLTQARGLVDLYQTQLDDTVIRAPIAGTILERIVEKGEFVTTGFVGDRGAKGYVVSMANLRHLQVELDINQADFARLHRGQQAIVTTDAYPDRKYEGTIDEISPEANRQKATVQVKVRVERPDEYLRPEMNASVVFVDKAGLQ